jgi:hypothetical protein
MTPGSNQPVTEMSTRNLPGGGGGKGRPARKADTHTDCGSLGVSQPYGSSRPVNRDSFTFYLLPFFYPLLRIWKVSKFILCSKAGCSKVCCPPQAYKCIFEIAPFHILSNLLIKGHVLSLPPTCARHSVPYTHWVLICRGHFSKIAAPFPGSLS